MRHTKVGDVAAGTSNEVNVARFGVGPLVRVILTDEDGETMAVLSAAQARELADLLSEATA